MVFMYIQTPFFTLPSVMSINIYYYNNKLKNVLSSRDNLSFETDRQAAATMIRRVFGLQWFGNW